MARKETTAFVEPAWLAPLRKYLPGTLLILLVILLSVILVLPLRTEDPAPWTQARTWFAVVIYLAFMAMAGLFTILHARVEKARLRHQEDTRQLEHLNDRFDAALNHIADGVMAVDRNGCVTLINRKACELTDWSAEEAVGKPLKVVFCLQSVNVPPTTVDPDETVPLKQLGFGRELTAGLVSKFGVEFIVRYETTAMIDRDGWLMGTMLTFRDVTELQHIEEQREALIAELSEANRQLEKEMQNHQRARRAALSLLQDAQSAQSALREREEHLRVLFEGVDDTLLVYDREGRILDCNTAAEHNTGLKREVILGKTYAELVMHDENGMPCLQTAERRVIPVDIHSSSIRYHTQEAVIAVLRDITPLKRVQDKLRESNERLRESNAALEEYARVASHDLQEPLRKIESFSNILLEDYHDALDQDGRHYLHILVKAAKRMRRLIKDVLAFSRAGSHEKPMEWIDLNDVLSAVRENLTEHIEEKHAVLDINVLPAVQGDQTQLLQLFQNLVSNALKFNDKDAPRILVYAHERSDHWEVCVRDNGIGMKEWETRYIFAPFKRLHGQEQYEGTGIGLAVCRKIIHRHGGTVTVESEPGKGSLFRLTFPRTSGSSPQVEKDKEPDKHGETV
ncbi:MAG: PAS domain S-box protein [Spartobacteria bacterium]|nr:PAS domain S-box protein [Spartobacteria bacterium]